jgi:hypothetical protein
MVQFFLISGEGRINYNEFVQAIGDIEAFDAGGQAFLVDIDV